MNAESPQVFVIFDLSHTQTRKFAHSCNRPLTPKDDAFVAARPGMYASECGFYLDVHTAKANHNCHVRPQSAENWASRPLCHT